MLDIIDPFMSHARPFAQHYYEYIRNPAVVLLLCTLVGPLLYNLYRQSRQQRRPQIRQRFDCVRLGLPRGSNLSDQYERSPTSNGPPKVKALFTYPVKSCRGVELAASEVGPSGLKYDRIFTFAQLVSRPEKVESLKEGQVSQVSEEWKHEWRFITQREFPRLALLDVSLWVPDPRKQKPKEAKKDTTRKDGATSESDQPSWASEGGCVFVRFPYEPDFNPFGIRTEFITLRLPLSPRARRAQAKRYTYETLSIWKDQAIAINVTNEIAPDHLVKLKHFLDITNPLALLRVDERNRRAVTRSLPKDNPGQKYTVGFGDAFPLHILSLASIQAIQDNLPVKTLGGKMDARRFRANIYLNNVPAYEEDTWKKILTGRCIKAPSKSGKVVETEGEYHVACRTARCKLPNVDQNTGIKDLGSEPYTTLRKTRVVDEGAAPHPCLGMQMIPLFAQGLLKVGDEITVAETGEHVYEKMFATE